MQPLSNGFILWYHRHFCLGPWGTKLRHFLPNGGGLNVITVSLRKVLPKTVDLICTYKKATNGKKRRVPIHQHNARLTVHCLPLRDLYCCLLISRKLIVVLQTTHTTFYMPVFFAERALVPHMVPLSLIQYTLPLS